jgi:hypothetical protein
MKNKNFKNMTLLFTSVLFLAGCNTPEFTPNTTLASKDFSIINGKTIKTEVFPDYIKLHETEPNLVNYLVVGDTIITYKTPKVNLLSSTKPNLVNLKNNEDPDLKGKPLRMVSIGGSLTAGVRDGGYFNEGIITSYINLVAHQMQLDKFDQPYFSDNAYNGYGRKALTSKNITGGVVPKFNIVKNNSAVLNINLDGTLNMENYNGSIDNFAVAFGNAGNINPYNVFFPSTNNATATKAIYSRIFSKSMTFTDNLFRKKFDFFTYEIGLDNLWTIATKGYTIGSFIVSPDAIFKPRMQFDPVDLGIDSPTNFMRRIEDNNIKKGCILNVPDITKFPYFKIITAEMMSKLPNSIYGIRSGFSTELVRREIYLLPTSEVDSLCNDKIPSYLRKGYSNNNPISKNSYVTKSWFDVTTVNYVQDFNKEASNFAKYFNFPLVDINSLYAKILQGGYITNDGVKVDASYPNGNFFSSDGIYPTAFGQAIIANEVIKTINNFYKTNIPLINTKEFLN